ncbi:hypothetical protein [Geitlerinema calcuttense]|uniref:Phage protein n=1 Tax=Geitlerinema calcuttense NRMC-F 0142 TaxID=2922238 RepID=A0ABT7LUY8_9CYAN|nr:hypothetical protein [Geitlerinema calcuttense]MDL5055873.1 hypothetical protein [Geitlerinema calcuttense NRMC-F 0142]
MSEQLIKTPVTVVVGDDDDIADADGDVIATSWTEQGEHIDSTNKPEMIDKSDLETIEAYFAVCFECESYTTPAKEEWHEAAADAMDAGWRVINGDVYCKDCKGLVLQRIEEVEGIRG